MRLELDFEIKRFNFNPTLVDQFSDVYYAMNLWPIVYILSDGVVQEAYVGETTDPVARMTTHLKNDAKKKLSSVHLISSGKFNKSATLDIESNLIKYISADGQFQLLNGNVGLANHNYYQKKDVYWNLFREIWDRLRTEGIAKHSLQHIDNSDLFKYSPYKSLTAEQKKSLLAIINNLLDNNYDNFVVEGGAGTGKTILAIYLFKLLNTPLVEFNLKEFGDEEETFIKQVQLLKKKYPEPNMALVVPMASFRNTLKKVFRNVKGLKGNMVIRPAELVKRKFDIVIVDEAHRLRRRVNLGTYFGAFDKVCQKLKLNPEKSSELDWVLKQGKRIILFYDENQSIKPSDTLREDFQLLKANSRTKIEVLKSQFRVRGGNDYVKFISDLLNCNMKNQKQFSKSMDYEFLIFESIEDMVTEIRQRESEGGLSRLIAGYAWEWISKTNKKLFDIQIGDTKLQWNGVANDWINSELPNAKNEVGCIHTTQGYDLNYAGIIFGNEISYDKVSNQIIIKPENYFDKNGKLTIKDPEKLKEYILNIYKTILLRGIKGTYVYACDEGLRDYLSEFIPGFKKEIPESYLPVHNVKPYINSVPLYDLKVAAGSFSEVQKVEDFEWIRLPEYIIGSKDFFACRIVGESMNKVIPNGSICLFKKYMGGSRSGKIVLVQSTQITDSELGSGYTIKEYQSFKSTNQEGWKHERIVLKTCSYDPAYKDIELSEDELVDFRVVGIFEGVIA